MPWAEPSPVDTVDHSPPVLLVSIPAFRSMAAGMMLPVGFVLLAALTLLPALLGHGVNRLALPWHSVGEHRSAWWIRFAARIEERAVLLALLASEQQTPKPMTLRPPATSIENEPEPPKTPLLSTRNRGMK